MGFDIYLCFLDLKTLGAPSSLETMVTSIKQAKFKVTELSVGYNFGSNFYAKVGKNNIEEDDIFKIAYEHKQFNFKTTFNPNDSEVCLEIDCNFNWDIEHDGQIRSTGRGFNWQPGLFLNDAEKSKKFSEMYLNLGKIIYTTLHPTFGWLDIVDFGEGTYFDEFDQLDFSINDYWSAFVSPELKAKLASQQKESKHWNRIELADGGFISQQASSLFTAIFSN